LRATVVDVVLVTDFVVVEVVVVGRRTWTPAAFRFRRCRTALRTGLALFTVVTVLEVIRGTATNRVLAPAVATSFRTTAPATPTESAAIAIAATRRRRLPVP
jgi:hypothetical protein